MYSTLNEKQQQQKDGTVKNRDRMNEKTKLLLKKVEKVLANPDMPL